MNNNLDIDLPLFQHSASSNVIAFPLNKRVAKIKRVAELMKCQKTEKAKKAYFRKIERTFKAQLVKSGVPKYKINAELDAFWNAVDLQLDR